MRADFSPTDMSSLDFYKLLTSVIIPRPIAWVSSTSADGVDNLAPHSFFTVASTKPPIVQFTPTARKDTLNNVEATGEFVVNFAAEELFAKVNGTGTNFPPEVSEFDAVGLTREPSLAVRPPRVAESPASIECTLHRIIEVGDCFVVMGDVVAVTVRPDVLADDGAPDFAALAPASRLGRTEWGLTPQVRTLERPEF